MNLKNQKGSLLIEVLISMSIAVIFSLAIGSFVAANNRLVSTAKNETRATAYAKEAMEQVMAIKQDSWLGIKDLAEGYYIVQQTDNKFTLVTDSNTPPGERVDDMYIRTIHINKAYRDANGNLSESGQEDPNVRRINVTVSWNENGANKSEHLTTYITNWKGE